MRAQLLGEEYAHTRRERRKRRAYIFLHTRFWRDKRAPIFRAPPNRRPPQNWIALLEHRIVVDIATLASRHLGGRTPTSPSACTAKTRVVIVTASQLDILKSTSDSDPGITIKSPQAFPLHTDYLACIREKTGACSYRTLNK